LERSRRREEVVSNDPAVERLFDPSRDPKARVRRDDWFPEPDSPSLELYLCETVEVRRRWYLNLAKEGRV
jgi:hypothetical protein